MNIKSIVLMVIRLAVAFFFIQSGLTKLGVVSPGMVGFIGGAFHNIGLTFLTQETWVTVLGVGEVLIGLGLVLGGLTRVAAGFALVIMLGAMNTKGWNTSAITKDVLLALGSIAIIIWGAGCYSLDAYCCKGKSCGKSGCKCVGTCKCAPGHTSTKTTHKDKEVIEA